MADTSKDTEIGIELINSVNAKYPLLNYKLVPYIAESLVGYFSISVGFFMLGFKKLKWIDVENQDRFYLTSILISGILLYITGLYDFAKGETFICFTNFSFGLLFVHYYINNIEARVTNKRMEGTFYDFWFVIMAVLILCGKKKGIVHIVNYFVTTIGFAFLIVDKYLAEENHWTQKVYSYCAIVASFTFWATGILIFVKYSFNLDNLNIV